MLEIKNVSLIFNKGTENEKKALDDISITINKGDFITVIGGNGAGKSSFLKMISGANNISSGKILLENKEIATKKEYQRAKDFAHVFQDPLKGTAPDMSIIENITLAYSRGNKISLKDLLFKTKLNNKELEYVKETLKKLGLGLEERLNAKVGLLSGGQRQALTLAMATNNTPKLLLLDEHTAALDPKSAKQIIELTNSIVKEKAITTIMVTHNIKHALEYGNRLILMKEGQIILDYSKEMKKQLTIEKIMELYSLDDNQVLSDKMLLG